MALLTIFWKLLAFEDHSSLVWLMVVIGILCACEQTDPRVDEFAQCQEESERALCTQLFSLNH